MEVGTKDILIMNPFADLFLVVSISIDNLSQRFLVIWEEGTSLVIFKSIVGFIKLFIMDLDVTDKAVISLVEGVVTHDTEPFDTFTWSFNIILPQKLKTTADG